MPRSMTPIFLFSLFLYDSPMSAYFKIQGSAGARTLKGTISVFGAKNAALKAIAASILYDTPLTLSNVPGIEDVSRMSEILEAMGASATFTPAEHTMTIDTRNLSQSTVTPEIAKRLRASIVLTGPLLARMGHVEFPHPGGDVIGERPIDLFLEGFMKMGAMVHHRDDGLYEVRAPEGGLHGAEIFFRVQSVTGTETLMMAATLARGTTILKNAALEPEIVWLAEMLRASGADITGVGTSTITIVGGSMLTQSADKKNAHAFHIIPDRIEAGSFLILGALAANNLTVTDIVPEHLESLVELLEYSGMTIIRGENTLTIAPPENSSVGRAVNVRTHEYPGFATDLQAPMMVYLTQAKGESVVFETVFEGRLNYTESLNSMGANIVLMNPHRVLVHGGTSLRGKRLESPDIRGGLAFVLAAAIAEGESEIHNVYHIDRGYESVEERLKNIGVDIVRIQVS